MKRLNPNTNTYFKKGDVREDNCRFLSYNLKRIKKNGYFGEHWVSPETFESAKQAISSWKRRANKTKQGTTIEMLSGAKSRAKEKGLPFDLDLEFLRSIITDTCPIFGFEFAWDNTRQSHDSPTLDRIVPELGYVKNNVRILSNLANTMKSNATPKQLHKFADWIKQNVINE
jgi:hypothetical protein